MVEEYVQALVDGIAKLGPNKAYSPIAADFHEGQWWVYIEVDTPRATFEVETHADTRHEAFKNALARFRRELTCANAA